MQRDVDLTVATTADWVRLIFHEAPERDSYGCFEQDVYITGEQGLDKTIVLCTDLYQRAPELLRPFTTNVVGRGFEWLMRNFYLPSGNNLFCSMAWSPEIAWETREPYIRSMQDLFKKLFAKMGWCAGRSTWQGPAYMWWDPLAFAEGKRVDENANRVRQLFLTVMSEILYLDARECQISALHGLGHLQRMLPQDVAEVVSRFVDSHPHLDTDLRQLAEEAEQGLVQ